MGCHTWFYRKVERTQEEAKEICLKELNKSKDLNWNIYLNRNYNNRDWSEYTDDILLNYNDVLIRQIRMVENNYCKKAVWTREPKINEFIDGKGFYISDNTMPHDLFRIGNYPDDKLFSLEETMEFIKTHNIDKVYIDGIIKFWEDYPDGMINFG